MDTIVTEPTRIKSIDDQHVYAYCKCPLSMDYAIVINKQYPYSTWYSFKCTKCGLEGMTWG